MFKGFYTLSSGMLNESRHMDVISNNLSNVSTPGYKADQFIGGTFQDEIISRTGNMEKKQSVELGRQSMIVTPYETKTDFSSGSYEETGNVLDFAIKGEGFFVVQGNNQTYYTRNGSFIIDNEGFLALQNLGRVMGTDGPIKMSTDNFNMDFLGRLIGDNGENMGTPLVVNFESTDALNKVSNGYFVTDGNAQPTTVTTDLLWKYVEGANTSSVDIMTEMLSSQRMLQSAAQVLKMYDQIASKAANDIGKV